MFADRIGNVHAFWRNDNDEFFHSRARGTDFTTFSAWTAPFLLDDATLNFDVSVDELGDIHLSYIRNEEAIDLPAGVYYRRLRSESNDWFSPILLYYSHYMRSKEVANSNVDITTSSFEDQADVYVTWDNYPRGRVFFSRSLDGGESWGESQEVDKPDDETGTRRTADIKIGSIDQHVLLIWQRYDAGDNCSQYYQWSDDYGETWTNPQQMLENTSGCGVGNQLLENQNGELILWTILQNQVNLLAWDQERWSESQIQHELSSIEDPETLSFVSLGCHQPLLSIERLEVIGCDEAEGADIWYTNRELSDISNWFSSPSDWNVPSELISSLNQINSPVLVSGSDELLHVLWSQAISSSDVDDSASIYYMGWDGERWSQPLTIFQATTGDASQPSAALDNSGSS